MSRVLLRSMGAGPTGGTNYVFFCPGCKCGHPVEVPRWSWNGSMEKPTFSPSLLCNMNDPKTRCHSFIREGKIEFLSDCFHELAGKTVEIPAWDDEDSTYDIYPAWVKEEKK